LYGGDAVDKLFAGRGQDAIYGGAGDDDIMMRSRLGTGDSIDGGDGDDTLHISGGDSSNLTLSAPMLTSVETVQLGRGHSYRINFDHNTVLGNHVTIIASQLQPANNVQIDTSNVQNTGMSVVGGAGNDTITGTQLNDVIQGGAGADNLNGGGGH